MDSQEPAEQLCLSDLADTAGLKGMMLRRREDAGEGAGPAELLASLEKLRRRCDDRYLA